MHSLLGWVGYWWSTNGHHPQTRAHKGILESFLANYNQWFTNDPPQRHRAHGGRTEKKKYGLGSHACYFLGWNYRYSRVNFKS
jgi:hypothetical protein